MPNILLTERCNRKCPYCFAQHAMTRGDARTMPLAEFIRIVDLLVAGKAKRLGILGGEPTLHPDFVELIHYVLARGLEATVFTNGLASRETLSAITAIDPEAKVKYVVNVNYPEITSASESERQAAFLKALGKRSEISLNMYRTDLDPCFVAELGEACGTSRRVRLGLAQPIVNTPSAFMETTFYHAAAPLIVRLVKACFARQGVVHFDCGFPLCMFDDEQLGALRRCGTEARFTCDPALDMAPGGETWACFPLAASHLIRLTPELTLADLRGGHQKSMQRSREETGTFGIFPACRECPQRKARLCAGGCLSHALRTTA